MSKKLNIILSIRPKEINSFDDEIEAISQIMNLISKKDKDKTSLQVLKWILENGTRNCISTSKMSEMCELNRLTCLHHLKRLQEFGLVKNVNGQYILSRENMYEFIKDLEKETMDTLEKLKYLAKLIDKKYEKIGEIKNERRRIKIN